MPRLLPQVSIEGEPLNEYEMAIDREACPEEGVEIMGQLNWFERFRLTVRYAICELRGHPEDPKHEGFCRCGEYQPNEKGEPMQWIEDWGVTQREEPT